MPGARAAPPRRSGPCSPCCRSRTSGSPRDAYFADGLTDEVRGRLAGVSGLQVIGGTSARQYKGTHEVAARDRARAGRHASAHRHRALGARPAGGGRVRVSPRAGARRPTRRRVWAEPVEGPLERRVPRAGERGRARGRARSTSRCSRASAAPWPRARRRTSPRTTPTSAGSLRSSDGRDLGRRGDARRHRGARAGRRARPQLRRGARAARAGVHHVIYIGGIDPAIGLSKARESAARAWALDSMLVETRLARAAWLMAAGERPRGADASCGSRCCTGKRRGIPSARPRGGAVRPERPRHRGRTDVHEARPALRLGVRTTRGHVRPELPARGSDSRARAGDRADPG